MTRLFNTASLMAAAALTAMASGANANLVHHYSFDDLVTGGNATDSVGGATGVWDGPANANIAVPGIIGTASQTNDEDNGVAGDLNEHYTIASLNGLDGAAAFSISLWFNQDVAVNNNSTYNGLFMTRQATSQTGGGGENWGLALEDNAAPRHIDWRVDGQSGTEIDDIPGGAGWHHVVMTYSSITDERKLYYDGALIVDEAVATPVGAIVTGGSWDIGNDTCCGNREFTGTLDDISIWDNELSLSDVTAIYQGGLQGIDAPNAIPEPSSLALLGLGGLMIARRRRG